MKVLSIGTDEQVFEATSGVRERQQMYAQALGHLDLIVLSKRSHAKVQSGPLSLYAAKGLSVWRLFTALRMAKNLPKPDVVTVQDPFEIGLVGLLAARHFKVPLHVQVHTDFLAPEYARHSLVNWIRVRIAGYVLKRASRIRVVSERIKNSLQAASYNPHAPVTVLPIYVDLEKFRAVAPSPELSTRFAAFKTKLLVVARLEPEKNVELAIRTFASRAPKDACLLIVGEGSERGKLETLSRTLAIADRVFFEGSRDPAPYYALTDLVLVPSKYEGYGLVIVEALAAGKPVLSTDVGVAREAGAMITNEKNFTADLEEWFTSGPRTGESASYPYRNFEQYIEAYRDDIAACAKRN